ncbi:MAG: MotA/TolQ/ExbB proton channel family protein [Hydrogenovibrio sp.]|uniref:MotA/TolQ/ExbB proton channel family protein n=1 Tax=Hydrogenovibrio sp. TaxID=2065821 RepID=UPI0028709DDD|nr:MotA/TolQ/ExbB proton channel family protein [Hydrogenovibrio sp.]MDR9499998.1 MotA/TolQ/ExbB proton channel family protein [Hydrogenovibrio sp.]
MWDISTLIEEFMRFMGMGGYVMPPLLIITIFLWYALTYRFSMVKTASNNPRQLIEDFASQPNKKSKSIMDDAVKQGLETAAHYPDAIRPNLDVLFWDFRIAMNKYKGLITVCLVVAPLLGLLGTVSGMIETFDSLETMTFMSQDGGIAAGISQALITTQFGLSISIPGLLVHSYINRKQTLIEQELDQLIDILSSNPSMGQKHAPVSFTGA